MTATLRPTRAAKAPVREPPITQGSYSANDGNFTFAPVNAGGTHGIDVEHFPDACKTMILVGGCCGKPRGDRGDGYWIRGRKSLEDPSLPGHLARDPDSRNASRDTG